jgi:vesicle-associated membrane protein 7
MDSQITISNPSILWSCVSRNGTILAEAGDDAHGGSVSQTAQLLLQKRDTPGWEFHTTLPRRGSIHPKLKGIKFHLHDRDEYGEVNVWVFACVYDPSRVEQRQVQSFIEKIVVISDNFRQHDNIWKYGYTLAAQESFAPILLQRMQEVSYLGKMAMVNEELDSLKGIMSRNIELILERGERIEDMQEEASRLQEMAGVFKKTSKTVKRKMMWQNAKHGFVLGTAITVGVAVLVVPPLVAIL